MSVQIVCSCGASAVMSDRDEVLDPRTAIGRLVAHAHAARHHLFDLCRGPDHPNQLILVLLPANEQQPRPSFRCDTTAGHHPNCPCPVGSHGGGSETPITVSSGLFDPNLLSDTAEESLLLEQVDDDGRPDNFQDFGCWCSGAISTVVTEEFGRAIASNRFTSPFQTEHLLDLISRRLGKSVFTAGTTVESYLHDCGHGLVIGITSTDIVRCIDTLPEQRQFFLQSETYRLIGGLSDLPLRLDFGRKVAPRIHGRARSQNGYHSAPYLFVAFGAVKGQRLQVERAFFHPVAVCSGQVCFTESNPEGAFATTVAGLGLPALKVQRLRDVNRMLAGLDWYGGCHPLRLGRRPDWLFFGRKKLGIIEVAGRPDALYRADLANAMLGYSKLAHSFALDAAVVEANRATDLEHIVMHLSRIGALDECR